MGSLTSKVANLAHEQPLHGLSLWQGVSHIETHKLAPLPCAVPILAARLCALYIDELLSDGVEDQLLTIIAWGVQITHVAPQAVIMHQSPTTGTHAERGERALQYIACECTGSWPSMIGLATLTSQTLCHDLWITDENCDT
jgi:hypothetical protein